MLFSKAAVAATLGSVSASVLQPRQSTTTVVNQTTCNGKQYTYQGLAGYGFVPSNATDKQGDTIGGIGSSIAFDRNTWHKTPTGYSGIVYALPDRGWNTQVRLED